MQSTRPYGLHKGLCKEPRRSGTAGAVSNHTTWRLHLFSYGVFSCELFSPVLSIQQFSLSTLLGGKKKRQRNKKKFSLRQLIVQKKVCKLNFCREKRDYVIESQGEWSAGKPFTKTSRLSVAPVCKNTLISTSSAQPSPSRWKLQPTAEQQWADVAGQGCRRAAAGTGTAALPSLPSSKSTNQMTVGTKPCQMPDSLQSCSTREGASGLDSGICTGPHSKSKN